MRTIELLRDRNHKQAAEIRELRKQVKALKGGVINDQIGRIKASVSDVFGVPIPALEGDGRPDKIVIPRHVAMALSRELGIALVDIGAAFGKGHAMVIHAVSNVRAMCETNPHFRMKVESIRSQITCQKLTTQEAA